jgi:hypothetical protein
LVVCVACLAVSCAATVPEHIAPVPESALRVEKVSHLDTAPKEELRLVPPEVYLRTYLQLFGGLAPLDAQAALKGKDGGQLFDNWDAYVSALGLPDYRIDIPRQTQTNALMVATFERLGIALCDRAVEHDLTGSPPPPVAERAIFAFDLPKGRPLDVAAFAARFDVLHKTFLGYPARLAPRERLPRYFALYRDIAASHKSADPKSRFSPEEAAWAAVCYGLVRHPEFHLY